MSKQEADNVRADWTIALPLVTFEKLLDALAALGSTTAEAKNGPATSTSELRNAYQQGVEDLARSLTTPLNSGKQHELTVEFLKQVQFEVDFLLDRWRP